MNNKIIFSALLLLLSIFAVQAQSILGKWKTIDDETKKPKSIVEIYEKSGKVYGKVVEILESQKKDKRCSLCEGEDKDKAVLGMIIIKELRKQSADYSGGTITDPVSGKIYKCKISLESDDKLKVRGYIGIELLGRTQYWTRVK